MADNEKDYPDIVQPGSSKPDFRKNLCPVCGAYIADSLFEKIASDAYAFTCPECGRKTLVTVDCNGNSHWTINN